ncbi:DedA family protein [Streptomyces macrolidinus]|uniref:DedA family protein n=1 Tax=Streptomyces macrolidinus TaxID=2952607 RepID=UPI003555CF84
MRCEPSTDASLKHAIGQHVHRCTKLCGPGSENRPDACLNGTAERVRRCCDAVLAAVCGDNIGFVIGPIWPPPRFAFRPPRAADTGARRQERGILHPARWQVITVGRFIEGLRQANGIIAGLSEMPWRRFLAFSTLGAALWVGTPGDPRSPRRRPHRHPVSSPSTLRAVPVRHSGDRCGRPGGAPPDTPP